jgi:hypothetical protein
MEIFNHECKIRTYHEKHTTKTMIKPWNQEGLSVNVHGNQM